MASELEICDLAYKGNLQQLINSSEQDSTILNKRDKSGRLAIHWACSGGHANIVDYILQQQAAVDVDVTDESNWTPLMIAVSAGREQIVRNLIAANAQVNIVNSTGQCPLHYGASKDHFQIAEILLQHNSHVNTGDKYGATPLHRAACKGHVKMTKLLLSYNADPNQQDNLGCSPLHLACEDDQVAVAKLLVEHGASATARNKDEKTPLELSTPSLKRQLTSLSAQNENIMDYLT